MRKEKKMMNCIGYSNMIDEYFEGKLGVDEKFAFENHLTTCPECSELVRLQKLAERIISEEKNSYPGFYLTGKIMNRIEESGNEPGGDLIRILRPALITISIAAAIFAGILIGNFSSVPRQRAIPIELTLMNDVSIESLNLLTLE